MKPKIASLAGMILMLLSVITVSAGDPPASDALLPDGLVMEQAYRPGPGAPVGKVAEVFGEAVIVHADAPRGYPAAAAYALYLDDLIVTREKARMVIDLSDGSRITLSAATRLTIDKSVYQPADKRRESFFGLSLGKARFLVKKIIGAKRSQFRVKTTTAIAGVRGSDFVVATTAGITEVIALENTRLEVVGLADPERMVVLTDYQRTIVAAGQAPTSPEAVPPAEVERVLEDFSMALNAVRSESGAAVSGFSGVNVGQGDAVRDVPPSKDAAVSGITVNQIVGQNLDNVATGKGAAANLGVVKIENSRVNGAVINVTEAENVDNVAVGSGSEANVGAVVVE